MYNLVYVIVCKMLKTITVEVENRVLFVKLGLSNTQKLTVFKLKDVKLRIPRVNIW